MQIIIEARQKLLFTEFKNAQTTLDVSLIQYVKTAWEYYVREKFEKFSSTAASNWKEFESSPMAPGSAKAPTFEDEPKYEMYFKISKACYDAISAATATINPSKEAADVLCEASRSVLSLYLDKQKGHSITDPKHFREFAAHWEGEFFKDMDKLNVKKKEL